MSPHNTALEQNEYRLVLVKSGSHAVWVENNGGTFRLPHIVLSRWTRQTEQLQHAINKAWRVSSVIVDFLSGGKCSATGVVVEILSSSSPHGLTATSIDRISAEELTGEERSVVEAILTGDTGARGPFSRMGWVEEARTWLQESVPDKTLEFTNDVHQFTAGGAFALVRLGTRCEPAYWLKAVGEPNLHEFDVTTLLTRLYPDHLPPLVATRSDWHAWVTQEVGCSFWEIQSPHRFKLAVSSLAKLQTASLGSTDALLNAGFADQRLEVLQGRLHDLFCYFDMAMHSQASTKVAPLTSDRLNEIEATVHDACYKMRQLRIPEALVHNDLNSGNILSDGATCVFTDWCEAGVGNPLITFEYLYECAAKGNSKQFADHLTLLYKKHWLDFVTDQQFNRALALTPILAVVSCMIGRATWLSTARCNDAHLQKHARGLARYIGRLAQDKRLKEVVCQ
jgi:Phosphotransferase enzyme family